MALGILSTYPPAQCGLAKFSESLRDHLIAGDSDCQVGIVQVLDSPLPAKRRAEVVATLDDDPADRAVLEALNGFDAVIVQHEYGIYGGQDGEHVTTVLDAVRRPVIVVLHTVRDQPTEHQRSVLEQILARADRVVVLSRTAARRLREVHGVPPTEVVDIPHGARVAPPPALLPGPARPVASAPRRAAPPTLLSWGLLSPGKGIEWAIDAVAELRTRGVTARYLIVGQTHPKVRERFGEAYRDSLKARAEQRQVADLVEFDAAYEDEQRLHTLIAGADVIMLPYESKEQVTSGVLIEAVAARKPIVATAFPHAVELLGAGAGRLVRHRDSVAMARELRRILTVPGVAADLTARTGRLAPDFAWPAVAGRYRTLAEELVDSAARLVA
ncbi:MAG: glycosyltransferase [Catenulispora sp.]